jgi:hypothetical protein
MTTPRKIYEEEILSMEPGLIRAVLQVMRLHIGQENTVDKPRLIQNLQAMGYGKRVTYATFERKVREAVAELRKMGNLVCSSSGEGGYFIARTWEEYDDFAQAEYRAKIIDMSETLRAMEEAAPGKLGRKPMPGQESLF